VPGSPVHLLGLGDRPAVAESPAYDPSSARIPARFDEDWRVPQATPHPVIVKVRRPPARPRPWLPTGTGMWIHEWPKTMHGNARQVIGRARAYGVTTIYVRTGTKKAGFNGGPILHALLPQTRGTNIKIVAWDFPTLENPAADARRLAAAVRYRAGSDSPQVAAVAPDIETGAEGTRSSWRRVSAYLQTLRRLLPHTPILTTVPWPSEQRRGRYPYATVARYSNAIMPMAYWYNRNPLAVTQYSIRWLRRYHRPVLPVGQGFDSHIDARYLPHSNQTREVTLFFRAALGERVTAVSLWSWQTAGPAQWHALATYRNSFAPHHPPRLVHRPPVRRPARPLARLPRPVVRPRLTHRS
jgi:hypothetical protein